MSVNINYQIIIYHLIIYITYEVLNNTKAFNVEKTKLHIILSICETNLFIEHNFII